ncbi:hypothetical protein LCGC14_1554560 [marine sediment metagenome]|uniref:Uncharacterized protein n=2 Tax=marine sediment metagenome TaxID=412755 RepID=A0A0F9IPB8_9ZZZZ
MPNNHKFTDRSTDWHWTEAEVSIDMILRKNPGVKRIRNKLKEKKRKQKYSLV